MSGGNDDFEYLRRRFSQLNQVQHFSKPVPCYQHALKSSMTGAVIGLGYGAIIGGYYAVSGGSPNPLKMAGVSAVYHSINFAVFLGVFRLTNCTIEKMRPSTSNLTRNFVSGFAGGCVATMVSIRQPRFNGVVFSNGLMSGLFMAVIQGVSHFF